MESKKAVGEDPTTEEGAQLTLDEARNASLAGARVAEPRPPPPRKLVIGLGSSPSPR
jgi:hypothetical protein